MYHGCVDAISSARYEVRREWKEQGGIMTIRIIVIREGRQSWSLVEGTYFVVSLMGEICHDVLEGKIGNIFIINRRAHFIRFKASGLR